MHYILGVFAGTLAFKDPNLPISTGSFFSIIVLLTFILLLTSNRKIKIPKIAIFFSLTPLLIALTSPNSLKDFEQVETLIKIIFSGLIITTLYNSKINARRLLTATAATSSLIFLALIFKSFFIYQLPHLTNTAFLPTESGKNLLSLYLAFISLLIFYFYITTTPKTHRIWLGLFLAIHLIALLYTMSRGGWLAFFPIAISLLIMPSVFLNHKNLRFVLVSVIILPCILILSPSISNSLINHIESLPLVGSTNDNSVNVRIELIATALEAMNKQPISGIGLGQFQKTYEKDTHNTYLQHLSEHGVILGTLMSAIYFAVPLKFIIGSIKNQRYAVKKRLHLALLSTAPMISALVINLHFTPILFFYYGLLLLHDKNSHELDSNNKYTTTCIPRS